MTYKQIIFDGVDVSGCECCSQIDLDLNIICISNFPSKKSGYCKDNTNCLYKQLAHKTQEYEELKHNYNVIKQCNDNNMQTLDEAIKEKHEIECELEKVKKQYKCYSCGTCNGKEDYYNLAGHHENAIKSLHKTHQQLDQLKADREEALKQLEFVRTLNTVKEAEIRKLSKTLAEIKDYCNKYPQNSIGFKKQILQKISEVENAR